MPPVSSRTLVVMRHAKAEQVGPTDFERGLAERGRADAAAAGRWLADLGIVPGVALVSAANRTTQTWSQVCRGAGWSLEPTLDRGLYAADVDTALDVIRLLDDDVETAVFVGHNPTAAHLAALLDDGEGDLEASNAMAMGYPTSATTVLRFDGAWSDLGAATATVEAFHVARG